MLGSVALLGGCASSGAPSSQALTKGCEAVSATLSDGPDPQADPVGYAEAQILPLRQIHTSDASLERDIEALSHAYSEVFRTDGDAEATAVVGRAEQKVNALCPGAAP